MAPGRTRGGRPYWYKDAKWVSGLLLVFALSLLMLVHNLVRITEEKPAVDTVSTSLALAFSPRGLDDQTEIAQLRQVVAASPTRSVQPIPGLPITLREEDLAGSSPRQVRLRLFRPLAELFYQRGPQGVASLSQSADVRGSINGATAILGIFTQDSHRSLQQTQTVLGAICVALLLPLLFFSSGFGRIGSPGVVILVASLPGVVLATAAGLGVQGLGSPGGGAQEGLGGLIRTLVAGVLPPLLQIMAQNYWNWFRVGLALAALAFVAHLLWWALGLGKPSPQTDASAGSIGA